MFCATLAFGIPLAASAYPAKEHSTPISLTLNTPDAGPRPTQEAEMAADKIAHAFAQAMSQADVRVHVRNAMRASKYVEHKLVLQEFVQTASGRRLVAAAAEATGTTVQAINELIAQIPLMDFYVPFREHRLTWRGGAEVAVGTGMEVDAGTFYAYKPSGQQVTYQSGAKAPELVWIFMHPVELKSLRDQPQADGHGSVIQEPEDGDVGSTDEGVKPSDATTTAIRSAQFNRFYSNVSDGVGAAELRFIATDIYGKQYDATRKDGFYPNANVWHSGGGTYFDYLPVNMPSSTPLVVHLREIDTWNSDAKGQVSTSSLPAVLAEEPLDCFWYYHNQMGYGWYDAEYMCGPGTYLEQYRRTIAEWAIDVGPVFSHD
jgi:hypothetical protein